MSRKVESAAAAGLALDPQPAPHELHESLRDPEPEAGATVLVADRGIGLFEVLEDRCEPRRRDADTRIDHREEDHAGHEIVLDARRDAPLSRELDRVAEEVQQDLPEAVLIADDDLGHLGEYD